MAVSIFVITIILLIVCSIKFPKIKIFESYYIVALIGALFMILLKQVSFKEIYNSLFHNEYVSPLEIVILFISMAFLSITLDNLGFFKYIAKKAVLKANGSQLKLFIILYSLISVLTVFTSNDVVILTFTPFIIYFCKNAKINPIPYLIGEFVAANTWSMLFLIGNPTNILISLSYDITFLEYFKTMALPTLGAGIGSLLVLLFMFRKHLATPIDISTIEEEYINKTLVVIGLVHLLLATVLLAISNYINIKMFIITFSLMMSLMIILLIYHFITKKEIFLNKTLKRLPYGIIPFLISMFILVLGLSENGYTIKMSNHISNSYVYGITSYLSCNLINNIPMSVLFTNVLSYSYSIKSMYAIIIGSNIGAFMTPIGALAGIMWLSILKHNDIKFSFFDFMKYGIIISVISINIALGILLIL